MILLYILITLVMLFILYESHPTAEEIGGSTHFFLSGGASRDMYLRMHQDGMSQEDLNTFVFFEDTLLQIERDSVCTGITRIVEAIAISNIIKEKFPKYNFDYHTIHLKQTGEPTKTVNSRIKC